LPSGFTTFNKLTSLSLFENEFEFDPDFDFGKLSSLRNLHMFDNKMLTSLPSSFKKLAQLTTLGLMKSKFETVPLEICALPNVHRLYIGVNNLTTLRPEIGGMTALSLLAADQNKIATLSHTMTQLKNLMSISMIHNKLGKNSDLNSEIICKIPYLEIARLRFNKLKSFRVPTDKFYRSLTDLDISDNDLESLPDSFSNLQSLRRADISRNQFTCIPKPVFDLPDLAELLAEENSITQVPSEIGQLTGLRVSWICHEPFSNTYNTN
jgi:leucine-rich repeat protein SHOC2